MTEFELDDSITSQDVIDALRFALMAQKDDREIVKLLEALIEWAPDTNGDRGVSMVLRLIAEGSLKVAMVDG